MLRSTYIIGALLLPIGLASPALAGMNQDLASCTAAEGRDGAEACTRVMQSGRLPDEQLYIGHFNRAQGYQRAGDYQRALADLNEVVKLRPSFARGYHARAFVQQDLGALDDALADLGRTIELAPEDWSVYYTRAVVLREKHDYDGAIADLTRAIVLKPAEQQVPLLHALILSDQGDNAAAREMINKVIANGQSDAAGFYARASVAFKENRLDAAADDLQKALKLQSSFTAAHTLMGRIEEARGNTAAASEHYRQALAGPAKLIEGHAASKLARERLAALPAKTEPKPAESTTPAKAASEAAKPAPQKPKSDVALNAGTKKLGCKLFLPATGVTISTDCSQ